MTMGVSDDEQVVRAAVAAVARLPKDAVKRIGESRMYTLLTAAMMVAVHRRFGEVPPTEQIQGYVETLKTRFPDGGHLIKQDVVEAVVWYAFGDESALDDVNVQEIRAMLFILPYAIVTELLIEGDELETFVGKVLEAAED